MTVRICVSAAAKARLPLCTEIVAATFADLPRASWLRLARRISHNAQGSIGRR